MTLIDALNEALEVLKEQHAASDVSKNISFILEDIKNILENKTHKPHLRKDDRGEGSYTALGYHYWYGTFDTVRFSESDRHALHTFSALIQLYLTKYDKTDSRQCDYATLLQQYQKTILKPELDRLSKAYHINYIKANIKKLTENTLSRLQQEQNTLSIQYQFILNELMSHLKDEAYQIRFQSGFADSSGNDVYTKLGLHAVGTYYDRPEVRASDLASLMIFDNFINEFKRKADELNTLAPSETADFKQLGDILEHYKTNVLQNKVVTQGQDETVTPGLINDCEKTFYHISRQYPHYQALSDAIVELDNIIRPAASAWVEEEDRLRRKRFQERQEEDSVFGFLLCLLNPLLGGCYFCCKELLDEAALIEAKQQDEAYVNRELWFPTRVKQGLADGSLSYLEIQALHAALPEFRDFALSLPQVITLTERFNPLVRWVCNALNYLFGLFFESNKVKTINQKLSFWYQQTPELMLNKEHVDRALQAQKNEILNHVLPSAPPPPYSTSAEDGANVSQQDVVTPE